MTVIPLSEFRMKQLQRVLYEALERFDGWPMNVSSFEPIVVACVEAMEAFEARALPKNERLSRSHYRAIVERSVRMAVPEIVP
jgi:hypothetical protein